MRIPVLAAVAVAFASGGRAAAAEEKRQPNIVIIFSDDHAYQAVSAYNHPLRLNQTPNIDRLAKEG
ncbi:MAG TPA: sulfatase, partial [Urbifossiella sp.]|nr:sulfatase [Urbifossiella sp.]